MPFKPNYRLQRADRKRAQEEKQQRKLERRAEKAAQRKAAHELAATPESNETGAEHES